MANSSKRLPTHRLRCPQQSDAELVPGVDDQERPAVRPKGRVFRLRGAKEKLANPSWSTFYSWLRDGEFEGGVIRIGHMTLLTEECLDNFLDRHTVKSDSQPFENPKPAGEEHARSRLVMPAQAHTKSKGMRRVAKRSRELSGAAD